MPLLPTVAATSPPPQHQFLIINMTAPPRYHLSPKQFNILTNITYTRTQLKGKRGKGEGGKQETKTIITFYYQKKRHCMNFWNWIILLLHLSPLRNMIILRKEMSIFHNNNYNFIVLYHSTIIYHFSLIKSNVPKICEQWAAHTNIYTLASSY